MGRHRPRGRWILSGPTPQESRTITRTISYGIGYVAEGGEAVSSGAALVPPAVQTRPWGRTSATEWYPRGVAAGSLIVAQRTSTGTRPACCSPLRSEVARRVLRVAGLGGIARIGIPINPVTLSSVQFEQPSAAPAKAPSQERIWLYVVRTCTRVYLFWEAHLILCALSGPAPRVSLNLRRHP